MSLVMFAYRRRDLPLVEALAAGLRAHTNSRIFYQLEGLDEDDFEGRVLPMLERCDTLLLVVSQTTFGPRIHEEGDWVRRMLMSALALGLRIVQVNVDGQMLPDELPAELGELKRSESLIVYSALTEQDSERLARLLKGSQAEAAPQRPRPVPEKTSDGHSRRSQAANEYALIAQLCAERATRIQGLALFQYWLQVYPDLVQLDVNYLQAMLDYERAQGRFVPTADAISSAGWEQLSAQAKTMQGRGVVRPAASDATTYLDAPTRLQPTAVPAGRRLGLRGVLVLLLLLGLGGLILALQSSELNLAVALQLISPTPSPTATSTPSATPTPRPTATRTPTPRPTATRTPTPRSTATRTPTPRSTATRTPTPRPTATRTPTPRPTATRTPTPLLRSTNGSMSHNPNDTSVSTYGTSVNAANFSLEVTFTNPYGASIQGWDYGVFFRDNAVGEYRLVLTSDKRWVLLFNNDMELSSGALPQLRTGPSQVNTLRLIVEGSSGSFYVNDLFAARLILRRNTQSGSIRLGTGFYMGNERSGAVTRFRDFKIDALATPAAGIPPRPTATRTPTATPTLSPEQLALTPVTRNADWTPVERKFSGITFVLVPAGCFMMGEDGAGGQQCFEPFWISKTEITQADFARLGGTKASANAFPGDDNPVESITWFEAQAFVEANGFRLPTEAEWEYAARGPDGLAYPWGSEWNEDNAVWLGNSGIKTAAVGSKPDGASWVGALDMAGNVWEWTLSEYRDYPYVADDGRNMTEDSSANRVLRGGSWNNVTSDFFRCVYRNWGNPRSRYSGRGFRLSLSY